MGQIIYRGPSSSGVVVFDPARGFVFCPKGQAVTLSDEIEALLLAQGDRWDSATDGAPVYTPPVLPRRETVVATLTDVQEGDVLVYRSGKWVNEAATLGPGSETPPPAPATVADLQPGWSFWHRGAGILSEDEALRAIDVAESYGSADVIDAGDWRLTSDGEVVVMHDSTTGRTCTSSITVASSTLAEFKALTMRARTPAVPMSEAPPTASEMLDKIKAAGALFSPEIKAPGVAQKAADLVVAKGMQDQCIMASSTLSDLAPAKAAGIQTLYFATSNYGNTPETAANIIAAGVDFVGFDYNTSPSGITDAWLTALDDAGVRIGTWCVDNRPNLQDVKDRLTGLGITLDHWASNDVPWVADDGVPAPSTTDPFAAGLWQPGMIPAQPWRQNDRQTLYTRGEYIGEPGAYRLGLTDPDNEQWMLQAWAVQALSPGSSITVDITYDATGDVTQWAAVAFNCPDDRMVWNGYSPSMNRGKYYAVILRQNGDLGLYRSTSDGSATTSLATAVPTEAISVGQTVTLQIEPNLPGGIVRVTRVDTGHFIEASDSTFRGGFFHFGKLNQPGGPKNGLKVSFSNVVVVP